MYVPSSYVSAAHLVVLLNSSNAADSCLHYISMKDSETRKAIKKALEKCVQAEFSLKCTPPVFSNVITDYHFIKASVLL